MSSYDPKTFQAAIFHDRPAAFKAGTDSPRAYLERCLAVIDADEPRVRAFAALDPEGARAAADASDARWRNGRPLSAIDGMPVGIKDLLDTKDMPTEMGCAAYHGHQPTADNVMVAALRAAGAVIVGKTVTAELGGAHPGPTTNPFDASRTPGGSSSGSAAAVAAGMLPMAIGSQVGGSIIRPAGYCGNFALKPSQGALNRGNRQTTSMSTHGPHAGSLADMWQTAIEIAARTGGDPGYPALRGPATLPAAARPSRLIVLETQGWAELDDTSKAAFEELLAQVTAAGGELLRRADHPLIDAFEQATGDAKHVASAITGWENHWSQRDLIDRAPDGVSARAQEVVAAAEAMTPGDYEALLLTRAQALAAHHACAPLADAMITLACPGPAPLWPGDTPGAPLAPRPTGDPIFNYATSLVGAPCVSLPLLAVGGMPVGVQVVGQPGEDARVTAIARWLNENLTPVSLA